MLPLWIISFALAPTHANFTAHAKLSIHTPEARRVCAVAGRVLAATRVKASERFDTFPPLRLAGTGARPLVFSTSKSPLPIATQAIAKLLSNPVDIERFDLTNYRTAHAVIPVSDPPRAGVSKVTTFYEFKVRDIKYPIYLAARDGKISFIHSFDPLEQWQIFFSGGALYAFWFELGPDLTTLEWVGEQERVKPAIYTRPLCHFPRP